MEHVLIISYFYPPCNLTASQRPAGWAKYLKHYGYEPIVITRDWSHEIKAPEDVLKESNQMSHEKADDFEVYRLPYKPGLRDKVFTKFSGSSLQLLSKPLTLINEFIGQYSTLTTPHRNILAKAEQLIKERGITKMIISGNPFDQFFFGYLLNKRTGVKWIADYRDDWNTSELFHNVGFSVKIRSRWSTRSEKKWVSTASLITSVSPFYTEKISRFTGVQGETIFNGFDLPDKLPDLKPDKNTFIITYNGSLYASQQIEPFLQIVRELIEKTADLKILLKFPGLAFDPKQKRRVLKYFSDLEDHLLITERIPRDEVLQLQMTSDVLLMLSHAGLKGIPSSKLYEYISLKKPVLLFPNDHDIIEETLNDTGLGVFCENEVELRSKLEALIHLKQQDRPLIEIPNERNISKYSRKEQTRKLADLLNTL